MTGGTGLARALRGLRLLHDSCSADAPCLPLLVCHRLLIAWQGAKGQAVLPGDAEVPGQAVKGVANHLFDHAFC